MTCDTIGGVWTYTMTLCKAVVGHADIHLATMGRPLNAIQRSQVEQLCNVSVHESAYRLCWMADAGDDVAKAGQWLLELERELQPDVVHLNDLGHGGLSWQSPVLLVAHSCVYSWWQAVHRQPPPEQEWQHYRALVQAGVRRADLLVAPSSAMLKAMQIHYGPARQCRVIANASDTPALAPDPAVDALRMPFLFTAGRIWDEAKNLRILAGIAASLPWPVYVAGEKSHPNGAEYPVENVHHLGVLTPQSMDWCLAHASIYVAPARYEPFGLAPLEAARAGCALVLGDITSLRNVWGEAARYVPVDDPDNLRHTLQYLINNPAERIRLARLAWLRAQGYNVDTMAADYLACYHEQARTHPVLEHVSTGN